MDAGGADGLAAPDIGSPPSPSPSLPAPSGANAGPGAAGASASGAAERAFAALALEAEGAASAPNWLEIPPPRRGLPPPRRGPPLRDSSRQRQPRRRRPAEQGGGLFVARAAHLRGCLCCFPPEQRFENMVKAVMSLQIPGVGRDRAERFVHLCRQPGDEWFLSSKGRKRALRLPGGDSLSADQVRLMEEAVVAAGRPQLEGQEEPDAGQASSVRIPALGLNALPEGLELGLSDALV